MFGRIGVYRWLITAALAAFLAHSCPEASAGTTGALAGFVRDATTGATIADAKVFAVSPSQSASVKTDGGGHFTFLSLAPDTYTLSVEANGYQRVSVSGYAVLADQTQNVQLTVQKRLTEIGAVTSRSSLNPVKPGTTTDVYSVNPSAAAAAAPIGGGGSLSNAYSAIASMPGSFVPPNQMGVNQSVYIRGGYYDQIGYEYDGVPVNRSFDNYPGHSAASLGQQELQIYTGGGGVGTSATGLAGFINQVIKTGTYPGSADISSRYGAPSFYHDILAEAGGAAPDRLFSYYVGFDGYNQDFRYFDNNNGAALGSEFPNPIGPSNLTTNLHFYPAVYPNCVGGATDPFANGDIAPPPFFNDPGCFSTLNPVYSNVSGISGREIVGNLHVGIPHKRDSGRDDVQLLYTSSAQFRQFYSGINDAGGSLIDSLVKNGDINPPHWPDYVTYPAGTGFLAPATTPLIPYYFPGSPTQRCANQDLNYTTPLPAPFCAVDTTNGTEDWSSLPSDYRDARWDTASIAKLQYQKNIGSTAYLRLLGYSFYSNTNRSGASRRGIGSGFGAANFDYEVDSHTRGAELQFADQLNEHHQLTGTLNYVTATTVRVNNFNYFNTPGQQVSNLTDGSTCYASMTGTLDNGIDLVKAGDPAPCNDTITQGTFDSPVPALPDPCQPGPTPACVAHAKWGLTYTGNQGPLNTVRPTFTSIALNDDWRPNDRLDVNLGLRQDRFQFDLASTDSPGKNFWFAAAQNEFCYNPATLLPVFVPQPPQGFDQQIPYVTLKCPIDDSSGSPVQTVHPDGLNGHVLLSNQYDHRIVQNVFQPRLGATLTVNPDTVFRFSAGRYVQQPQNYEVQYNSLEENLASQLIGFFPYGFFTPRHDPQPQLSNNYDLSYERHFKGTDMAMKLTPYYRYATGQLYGISAAGSSASINTGIQQNIGVELQFTKGDFNRNGLSGLFSYTYLNAKEKWANFAGTNRNPVDIFNDYITQYNALTKAAGGALCYDYNPNAGTTPGVNPVIADPKCLGSGGFPAIHNAYYAAAPQPLFDRNGWYDSGLDVPWTSPNVFALVLNYRHQKLAITPAITLNEGTSYGAPSDVIGVDPRTCKSNLGSSGFTSGDPLAPDYTSCKAAATPSGNLYIPNPETGHFDGFGEFRQPWQLNAGLQITYDLTDKLKANILFTNLLNRCFGGSSTPWTAAYAPNSQVCGYSANTFYIANFYNGSSPNDIAANGVPLNPYFAHSFVPSYGDASAFNYPLPLNIYVQLQVKL